MTKLKKEALKIIFHHYPPSDYDPVTIHECADEWEQRGHVTCAGIVYYYRAYFSGDFR